MPTAAGSHLAYLTMWATEWHGSTREWAADMGDILLEVIATDVEDARMAAEGGADRLEVCAGMDRDGTTPDLDTVMAICDASLPLDMMAMVRPRGGDFTYTPAELRAMTDAIDSFRHAGVDGVVVATRCFVELGCEEIDLCAVAAAEGAPPPKKRGRADPLC